MGNKKERIQHSIKNLNETMKRLSEIDPELINEYAHEYLFNNIEDLKTSVQLISEDTKK